MVTLEELRLAAKQRADMENSEFVTDEEWNSYINHSIAELHDILIGAYNEEYVMESVIFTTSANQLDYDLPNGTNYSAAPKFYKLRGVDAAVGGDEWNTVKRFNFNRRNENNAFSLNMAGLPYLEYRIVGSKIRFNRQPDPLTQIRLWYHPPATKLVADSDELDPINGFDEYVVVDAAIKAKDKEESDTTVLQGQKLALKQRLESMAQNRDANEPESVTDVFAEDDWFLISRG